MEKNNNQETNLKPNEKLNIEELFKDLENYKPRRRHWVWRDCPAEGVKMHKFTYRDCSVPLKNSIGLPASKYFNNIDPQPKSVITTEIGSVGNNDLDRYTLTMSEDGNFSIYLTDGNA